MRQVACRRHLANALLRIEPDSREIREVAAPLLIVPETAEQNVPVVGSAAPITTDMRGGAPVLPEGEKRVEPRGASGLR